MEQMSDLNALLLGLESDFLSGRMKIPYDSNRHVATCWRVHNCKIKRCPAYGKERVRCWQMVGTFCNPNKKMLTIENKFSNCKECPVFLQSTRTKELRALEALNNIVFLLDGYETASVKTNRMIMQYQERVIQEFGLTIREVSLLPMILNGEKRVRMAQELGISINTVKTHCRHLFRKIGVRSVTELRDKLASRTTTQ
jgi:DNA-binding CsgD family transcriptional regulator